MTENLCRTAEITAELAETAAAPLGKFADAQALLAAYCELEKEFTRKCQRLAELASEVKKLRTLEGADGVCGANAAAVENMAEEDCLGTSANGGFGKALAAAEVVAAAVPSNPAAPASPESPENIGGGKGTTAGGVPADVDAGGFAKSAAAALATAQAGGVPAESEANGANAPCGITFEDLARHGSLVEEFVLGNDKILSEIFATVALRQASGAKSPKIISGSGAIALSCPKRPKSLDEATNLAREFFK